MKKLIWGMYILVSIVLILIAAYGEIFHETSEYVVSAHLYAMIISVPLGLSTLALDHGSFISVAIALILGGIQWFVVGKLAGGK